MDSTGHAESQLLADELVCAECGYDLRGLPGDPVQCSECGRTCPIRELRVNAAEIQKELRRLETLPTACVASFLVMILALGWAWWTGRSAFGVPVVVALAGYWLLLVHRFAAVIEWEVGWIRVLLLFHITGLVGAVLLGTIWFAGVILLIHCTGGPSFCDAAIHLIVMAMAVSVAGLFTVVRLLNRRARIAQRKLQHRLAIRLAQLNRGANRPLINI